MYLGIDYTLALARQAELLRSAEELRNIKQLRSRQPAEGFISRSEVEAARPNVLEDLGQRAAS